MGRQRGWAALVVLLVVVVIVAFLSRDALLKYLGPAQTVQRAGPGTRVEPAPGEVTAPAPANAMDRARGLQDSLQKESARRGGD
jgi:hypothetical protein